ncbi:transposase [Hymenobacter sp. B81]|uniref:transposase n=1 Tax=Hymenobacter sp. B81 TaxID=3344878 RepID=UPI0037DC3989
MPEMKPTDGQPVARKKYTPAFKAECVRQVAAGAPIRHGPRPGSFPCPAGALAARGPGASRAQQRPGREESKRLRAELKRVQTERDILKKAVTIFAQPYP